MLKDTKNAKLGIIAGGGALPGLVADAALRDNKQVHIVGIYGEADELIANYNHDWIKWGEFGHLFRILKKQACREIVIIGSVKRPDISQVKLDLGAIKNLPFILSLTFGGDDSILSGIVKFIEKNGFRVRGAHEIAPELLAGEGLLGNVQPSSQDRADIAAGVKVVRTLGELDIGQAAVISRGYVLAVEAAEGTDEMLRRCVDLRQWGAKKRKERTGVLVKCPKPAQEARVDMPTVGSKTVEMAARAGLSGIALASGGVLLADRERMVQLADAENMFLVGVTGLNAVQSTGQASKFE